MIFKTVVFSIFTSAFALSVPAVAQMTKDSMSADSMKMSKSEMKTMQSCQKMGHDAMMKSKKCSIIMKAHPDMMKNDDMMTKH